ncbi:MAG: glycyl-radical enzyme activating protein [Planctomycetes bacterium]|nr:glycyl-radical enzyme activating protein [Planctomycetota bacterium]
MAKDFDNTSGMIFDIQRCSLHDGPGIRTTVFFKGCPLRCLWCHNPESVRPDREIAFYQEFCVGCGACAAACPHRAHRIENGSHFFDRAFCEVCGRCVEACSFGAMRMTGRQCTVKEIMDEVRQDVAYYRQSGGGLTVSGGEPLLQPEFLKVLLEAAKAEGVNTCVETGGFAPRQAFEAILPLVDLFLFDYKAARPDKHREFTGADNELILSNLDFLCRSRAAVRLRCPLVPGINDSPEHFRAIAEIAGKYPAVERVELLAYHNTAGHKYARHGYRNPLPDLPSAGEEIKNRWLESAKNCGCEKASLG